MLGTTSMTQFTSFSPAKIIFGNGTVSQVSSEVQQLNGSKCLLVTDPGVAGAGLLSGVEKSLAESGLDFVRFDKVEPEPRSHIIDDGAALLNSGAELL